MLQIQPKFAQYRDWYQLAVSENLRFEILEFSSAYVNTQIPDEMIQWYRKTGFSDSLHGAFMDNFPISPDFKVREISRQRCEDSCQLAKTVGAKNVILHSTALPFLRGPIMEGWCKEAAAYYQGLAQKYDLNIYLENFHDVTPEPLKHFMNYITDPRVGLCLDVGHANYTRVPVSCWIEELGDHIGYLHLSDNGGEWDDHCVLGSGTVDFACVSDWYLKQDKEIPITLEVPSVAGVEESLQYLKEQHFFGY